MENNLKKPIHVEFYGLPGSGKSTISHKVADMLRKDGYNVIEPSFATDNRNIPIVRKIKKIFQTLRFYVMYNEDFKKLVNLVRKNNYHGIETFIQVINIIPKMLIYRRTNENSIYIWDEGIVQSAISLSTINDINSEKNKRDLYNIINCNYSVIKIYIDVSIKTAIYRMKKRSTNYSRVEKANGSENKEKILEKIYLCVNQINISNGIKESNEEGKKPEDNIKSYIIGIL